MNIGAIITATVVVAAVGLFIGIFLSVAGKKFAVETDEREVAVREALPGNNCGGCGYPGCDGAVRELLGAGQLFGQQILPLAADGKMGYEPITIFILAPGAFFVLAMLAALQNKFKVGAAKRGIDPSEGCGCCSGCDSCNNTMCKGGKQA